MIRKDYLLKYVDQLAKVLAEILSLKNSGKSTLAVEIIDSTLKDLKVADDFDLNQIPQEYHESVGDLLKIKGEINNDIQLLKKALNIYITLNTEQQTFSIDRNNKMEEINYNIKTLNQ